jgi:hypothetical protein
MDTSDRNDRHGAKQRSRRRFWRAPLLVLALTGLVASGPLLGAAGPAAAETTPPAPTAPAAGTPARSTAPDRSVAPEPTESTTPEPTPSPSTAPTETPAPEPSAPTIGTPGQNAFVGGAITVGGSGDPGQEIQLVSPTGGEPLCIRIVDGSGGWECTGMRLPSGPSVSLRAVVSGRSDLAAATTVRVLQAPAVTGGATGQPSSNGLVRGTGYPGATVTATLSGGQRCSFTVDASGAWACLMQGLVSGSEQISASQQTGFSAPDSSPVSDPVMLLFDIDAPTAPVVASPVAGATLSPTGATYSGQGENGATVTVFAGAYSICSAVVSGGTWSCSGGSGVADGSYDLRAVQQDAAGNVSAGSPAIRVGYGVAQVTPSPAPTAGTPAVPAPTSTPQPSATPAPTAPGTPSATPAPSVPAPGGPESTASALPPELNVPGGWNDPTQFSTAVIPPWTVAQFPWLQAAMITLGVLGLLVVPARLLAGTLSRARNGRPVFTRHRVSGRNRAGEEFEVAPTVRLNRWVVGTGAILAASVFVLLSGPIVGAPAYLRLFLAVALALAVVNAVATLVPQWWGSRALRAEVTSTFLPRYLLVVAIAALASRVLDVHPALLFGLLGSVVVRQGPVAGQRGRLAAIRAASLLGLGLVALLVVGTLPVADTFLSALAAEFANTIVLASIGSAVLVLIPVGSTSGRSILAWSPPVWAALAVPAFLTLFTLMAPMLQRWQDDGTAVLLWAVAAAFASLSVAGWAWQRWVLPALR